MKVQPKKNLGQHFLVDTGYCSRIIGYADIQPGDTVIEIGPGTGQLTGLLLETAQAVIAIEFDPDMVEHLQRLFPGDHPLSRKLTILNADVLQIQWQDLPEGSHVRLVGNLPYNISTKILSQTAEVKERFHSFTFMVQKEVAERILAKPGNKDYGYFTLLMEYHFQRFRGFAVPPGAFVPPPKVVSYVMRVAPREPPYPVPDYSRFLTLLKVSFQQRRKTLWNNLKRSFPEHKLSEALSRCRLDPRTRPEELDLQQFACLARML
jgi:16S rRNA (adenine1518-N6/adenine1519-N6)-dimethyltransferase